MQKKQPATDRYDDISMSTTYSMIYTDALVALEKMLDI